jgi:hypothetical protein
LDIAERIVEYLLRIKGIRAVFRLDEEDRLRLLDVETAAEKKAFMGLGMCYNSGIRDVLRCDMVFVGITGMDFDWGCQSHIILKKGEEIVGEEVLDEARIEKLKERKDVWFLHKNFVIYKDSCSFPEDLVAKRCCFELPALTSEGAIPGLEQFGDTVFCFPSTAGDVFLKERYYDAKDERGTGTAVFGFKACR